MLACPSLRDAARCASARVSTETDLWVHCDQCHDLPMTSLAKKRGGTCQPASTPSTLGLT